MVIRMNIFYADRYMVAFGYKIKSDGWRVKTALYGILEIPELSINKKFLSINNQNKF